MIKLYDFDSLKPEEILNRDIRAEKNVEDVVDAILADVRTRGDEALKEYALKFDGAEIENLQVTQEEIEDAFANMDPYFLETLKEAAANIESFHRQQVHKNFVVNDKPGIVLGQKYTPIEKAGVYVPGGTAAYPSTVLMDVIPAKVAGVSEIVMTTPAGKDGKVNPVILAAAATAGVTKIFKTGGAQAVAALAYGTRTIPAVDKIVGPGNIYVATAKRKVFGLQHHCTRASGSLCGRPVRRAERDQERGQHLPGPQRARGAGRLLRGPQPHPAHQRHRPLLQPPGRGRVRQEIQLYLLHPGGAGRGCPPHCRFCRAGGPARPRPQCDDSIREIKGGLPSQAASRPAPPKGEPRPLPLGEVASR